MKVTYKIVRVYPDGFSEKNLQLLEDLLNDGYIIERVEELESFNYKCGKETVTSLPYSTKDYILFKFIDNGEENEH